MTHPFYMTLIDTRNRFFRLPADHLVQRAKEYETAWDPENAQICSRMAEQYTALRVFQFPLVTGQKGVGAWQGGLFERFSLSLATKCGSSYPRSTRLP